MGRKGKRRKRWMSKPEVNGIRDHVIYVLFKHRSKVAIYFRYLIQQPTQRHSQSAENIIHLGVLSVSILQITNLLIPYTATYVSAVMLMFPGRIRLPGAPRNQGTIML